MADNHLPLLGVILCCTSIPPEKRSELASFASQMGAVHKLDLTSDVTHLVVGDYDTPKYKFVARERPDVKCVLSSWIEAVRASWLEGGETKVEDLEQEHKLPTFTGLRICVTGFDDLVYRKELEDSINNNGGDYRGNLTRDVTHLVAKEASGQKYNFAVQWGITTVAVEWLEHSLERGMILDETSYHLLMPPEERGRNAWTRRSNSNTSLGKRTREAETVPQNARKLRRTASARLSSQNVGLWSELVTAPIKLEKTNADVWDEQGEEGADGEVVSKKPDLDEPERGGSDRKVRQTLKKSFSEANLGSILGKFHSREGLFQGLCFLLRGFDEKQTAILHEHLPSHGAEIVHEGFELPPPSENEDFRKGLLVIPHTKSIPELRLGLDLRNRPTVVTELWIERCIGLKRLEDPQVHVTSTPFSQFPIEDFKDLVISSTGFEGVELLHLSKVVKLMGSTYEEFFTPESSVLISNHVVPGHEKLQHAHLWSVPAVKPDWLWESIQKANSLPYDTYLVQPLMSPNELLKRELENIDTSSRLKGNKIQQNATNAIAKRAKLPAKSEEDVSKRAPASRTNKGSSNDLDSEVFPNPRGISAHDEQSQTSMIYLDDDEPILPDSVANNDASLTPAAASISTPLQEITPNSSPPKRSASPSKSLSPSKNKDPPSPQPQDPPPASEDSSLGPAINSLLAHHQRTNSNPQSSDSSDQPRLYRRRRRHLLGRAPSNLSSHSNNVIDFSRASSVDTLNTDGLGTPLEPSNNNTKNNTETKDNNPTNSPAENIPNLYTASSHHDDDPDRIDEAPLMTQLGYEDPNVAAWRERVAIKMGGGTVKEGKGGAAMAPRGKAGKGESLGIAKRTRLASSVR